MEISDNGSGVPLELQPESISFPGDTTCQLPMQPCGVGNGNYSGDLPTFLYPFATSDGATDVEIYWRDLELAYDETHDCLLSMGVCDDSDSNSISLDDQLTTMNQIDFFQMVGQGDMGSPPCPGPLQSGAMGNCAYLDNIDSAAGPH